MIYLSLNANQIKILVLKKTLLGQQETLFYEKKHETQLLEKGKIINIDIVASAIKEALNLSSPTPLTEKQVFLTLPQETFYFLRADVPNDIAPSAIQAFIRDKARTVLPLEMDNYASEYFIQEADKQKTVTFYAIDKESLEQFQQCLALIDLKLYSILPETLAYFKLFEKTLRREKKESIFYVNYEKDSVSGYLFDSTGLMDAKKWEGNISKDETVEKILKTKTTEYETNKLKLNRLILSGSDSETIRQDTFTKAVGVWTNPLKRIIPTFYKEYVKMLVLEGNKQFPILNFDICFGSFIFDQENKNFSLLKGNTQSIRHHRSGSLSKISLPKKEIFLFLASFILSFIAFIVLSKFNFSIPKLTKNNTAATPTIAITQPPTATPTPSFKKDTLNIKILNGVGTPGKASEVKNILKNMGYVEFVTDNADNTDYKITEIQVKQAVQQAGDMIKTDLKDYTTAPKISVLDDKETADVIVIIGADFK